MEIFDIIILAMVAGFIFLRLRGELGNKTGNEPLPPSNPHPRAAGSDRVVDLQGRPVDDADYAAPAEAEAADPRFATAFNAMRRLDSHFSPAQFLNGAAQAYPMILEAFWAGDRDTLKNYLSPAVFDQFDAALKAREEAGHKLDNRLLEVTAADIVDARLEGKTAEITVHFSAEIIAVTRDKDGKAIEGNLSDSVVVNDNWTFARDLKSRDPSWSLVATRAG